MDRLRVTRKVKIDGKWKLVPVALDRAGRPEANHVLYKGERIAVEGGAFYLDSGHGADRKRISCGSDRESVRRALKTQAAVLSLRRAGMDVDNAPGVGARQPEEDSLQNYARDFVRRAPAGYSKRTVAKYRNAIAAFASWAALQNVRSAQQVDAVVIDGWAAHMRLIELLDTSTIKDKVLIVLAQLTKLGVEVKLARRSLRPVTEKVRKTYLEAQLDTLFAACTIEEFELFQTYLLTGFRFQEVEYLGWDDVDPQKSTIRVSAKRELGFTPKTYHERTVPVPRSLIELLQKRGVRDAADAAGLIFATTQGEPDTKMLRKLKRLARRAGANCGRCKSTEAGKPVSCKTHPVCDRWTLHKFRHTYATMMLRDKVDIATVSRWLGHRDLATTQIYLHALEAELAQPQVESSSLAAQVTTRAPVEGTPVRQRGGRPRTPAA